MRLIKASILLLYISLFGCGGGQNTITPPPAATALNGNYDFTATSGLTNNIAFIGGPLQTDSGGNVTGLMHIDDPTTCFALTTIATVTGGISPQGTLNVTTNNIQSKVITVNASVSSDGKFISGGSYNITGTACAAGDHGTITGFQVQPVAGAYSGQIIGNLGTATINATLTQSPTADAKGLFSLTGGVTFVSSPCFTSATITSSEVARVLVILNLTANDGSTIDFTGVATDPTAKTIEGNFTITGGTGGCAGDAGQIVMSHP